MTATLVAAGMRPIREASVELERGTIVALMRHPVLCWEAVRTWLAVRRHGGVGADPDYLRWRTLTAYGEDLTTTSGRDLLNYLVWRREMRSVRKWERV